MQRRCALAAAVLLSGCLSNPTPHPATEATTDTKTDGPADATLGQDVAVPATDVDESGDTAPDATLDGSDTVITPDPPIVLRDLLIDDLDRDGYDDVVLQNWLDDEDGWGLWIYDGADGRLGFAFRDRIIHTRPRPDGVARLTLRGGASSTYELAVLGPTLDDSGEVFNGSLQIIEVDGRDVGTKYQRETGGFPFIPDGGGLDNVEPLSFLALPNENRAVSVPRLLIADYNEVFLVTPNVWDANGLAAATTRRIDLIRPALLQYITALVRVPSTPQDTVAVWQGSQEVTFFAINSLDPLDATSVATQGRHQRAAQGDLKGDGKPDLAGFVASNVSVVTLSGRNARRYEIEANYTLADNDFDDVRIADIDNSGQPDIVLLDDGEGADVPATVRAIRDPVLTEGNAPDDGLLSSASSLNVTGTFPGADFHPIRIAVGKFNNRGIEIWGFDVDGQAECMRWDTDFDRFGPCGQ